MGQIIEKKPSSEYVKKHVATIHCSNSLTLLQRKISNGLLHHAYPRLQHEEKHQITVRQLCNIIGYSGNNHKVIKDAFRGLLTTVMEWNINNEISGEEDWTASTFLASVNIKGAICTYAYSPHMREMLYSPSVFGKVNLIIQARFHSSYGLALYENCVRFHGLPSSGWFELEVFRKLMGVPKGTYIIFRDFKRRVIDKAVEEVNTYSDLIIEPEIERTGYTVKKIRFKLKEREKKKRLGISKEIGEGDQTLDESESEDQLTIKLKNNFGLSKSQINKLFFSYTKEIVEEKIKIIESSNSFNSGKIKNLAAYLLDSLKNDYQSTLSAKNNNQVIKTTQNTPHNALSEELKSLNGDLEHWQYLLDVSKEDPNLLNKHLSEIEKTKEKIRQLIAENTDFFSKDPPK